MRPVHLVSRFLRVSLIVLCLGATASAWGAAYSLPENGDNVVGAVTSYSLSYEDTLAAVAQRLGLGYRELLAANPGVDPWLPGEGTSLTLPTAYILPSAPREGVVINVAEYRLYYYPPNSGRVITFPVGLGRQEYQTPLTRTTITGAIENPSWTPTAAARREHAEMGNPLPGVVPPGPDNPLGSLALMLDLPGYFIHGTNKPFGVGQMASHGCIRLYDAHIETLVEMTSKGTPVHIVNEPYKVGRRGDQLYVEVHQDIYGLGDQSELERRVVAATKNRAAVIDRARLEGLLENPTGIPSRI